MILQPALLDPEWEPSDAELRSIAKRAWDAARVAHLTAQDNLAPQLAEATAKATAAIDSRARDST